jgi:hypothetical protein
MIQHNDIVIYKGIENLNIEIINIDANSVEYKVLNAPVCEWDQHSRARIGVKFFNYKVSSNPHYVFYTHVYNMLETNEEFKKQTFETLEKLETIRQTQTTIPTAYNLMTRSCTYWVKQELTSLRGQMARRLKLCEEEFIVGVHWLLRDKLIKAGVEEAKEYLPGCDRLGYCDYSSADYLSNMFGCLFRGCGRWPDEAQYASFNESCTTNSLLEEQLKIKIQKSKHEIEIENANTK